jgi:hypothetical protein
MEVTDAGCLEQRSLIDRLRLAADGWTRERVSALDGPGNAVPPTLIILSNAGKELTWDLDRFFHGREANAVTEPLAKLIPHQGIMRLFREKQARAAALISPIPEQRIGMQLADLDHEQSLTTRVIRDPEHGPTIEQWDFGRIHWPFHLHKMLVTARGTGERPATEAVARAPRQTPRGRRAQARELRDQLREPAAAAASWLQ